MMPDITNNTLRKAVSNDKLKGEAKSVLLLNIVSFTYNLHFAGSNSNSGLPDVTASTGFGGFLPAKELKAGSVMDILGKYFSSFMNKGTISVCIYRSAKVRVLKPGPSLITCVILAVT